MEDYIPIQNPSTSDQYALEGWRLLNNGDFSKAEEMLNHALNLNPYNGEAYAWLAQLHQEEGNLEEAWNSVLLGVFVESTSPTVLIEASEISQMMGNKEEAMSYLVQAYQQIQCFNQSQRYYDTLHKRGSLSRDLVPQIIVPRLSTASLDAFDALSDQLEIFRNREEGIEFLKWLEDERVQ